MNMSQYFALFLLLITSAYADTVTEKINNKEWIHGAPDCHLDNQPPIDILAVNESTFILRQNKCTHYEAPFIYVLFGSDTVFIQDTGATADSDVLPLFNTIEMLINNYQKQQLVEIKEILVTHSHSHSDHTAGDVQFAGKHQVTLVKGNSEDIRGYFGFEHWPAGEKIIDLGGRKLTIIPLPGHQEDAVAVFDHQTNVMLTGDSFYPGRLYIRDWLSYKESIEKLFDFALNNKVNTFLGTHIEMTRKPGKDYVMGSTYQPQESSLVLSLKDLKLLNVALKIQRDKPTIQALNRFIIYPVD